MWPWSTIRALRAEVAELQKALRIEQKISVTADNQLREYRARLKDFQSAQERASFASDGSILPGSPLAEKVSKLQKRARVYGSPLPLVRPIAPAPLAVPEEKRAYHSRESDGMDSMYAAAVFGLVTAKGEEKSECRNETAAPEFKSGGGGDFGGGGATGSWDSSSSSSSDSSSSDSGSSSSDSSSSSD